MSGANERAPLLAVEDLSVEYRIEGERLFAVRNASLCIHPGEVLALVGESGCGKTSLALSILGLLPKQGRIAEGSIRFKGEEMRSLAPKGMRQIRGNRIAMSFQEPSSALNPVIPVGRQVAEPYRLHRGADRAHGNAAALEMMQSLGIAAPEERMRAYPHQLSGGTNQRVALAMALICEPDLLIADEPATALDMTIRGQVFSVLDRLRREKKMAILLITHDLAAVRGMADRVCVMYASRIVEEASIGDLFERPRHPYTQSLKESLPCAEQGPEPREMMDQQKPEAKNNALLAVRDLAVHFPLEARSMGRSRKTVKAVDGVSFALEEGTTLGLVGESGCGKTTLGRTILRLTEATAGEVRFEGINLFALSSGELRRLRRKMQIIFQDPYTSLNPRMTVRSIVGEGLKIHRICKGKELEERVADLLGRVGLDPSCGDRYPHEFSGGQRQRIGIARALSVNPRFVVCDEPVSALDVSVQAQVINLLLDLKESFRLTYLFISHDLSVVRRISDRVAVMYLGKIVEIGPAKSVFENPGHPYTKALLSAVPTLDPNDSRRRIVLEGDIPSPIDPPKGCPFHPRCPCALPSCSKEKPPWKERGDGHGYRCVLD